MFLAPLCPSSGALELYRWLLPVALGSVKMEHWGVLVFHECYVLCVIWVCLKHFECRGDSVWVSQVVECEFLVRLFRSACICGPSSSLVGWG
jgi:hypothetical protein